MAPRPPPQYAEPDIRESGRHLRPDIYRAVESIAAKRIEQPAGLSGFQPPAVASPSAAGEAAAAAFSPVFDAKTGKEITRHQAVRQHDPGALPWNTNTAWRFVRSDSRGGSPAADGGSSVDGDTAAAIDRHLSFGSGAADPQQPDAIRLCQAEFCQPLYPASSGDDSAKATAFQPQPRPTLLAGGGGLFPGAGKPCGVRPTAAAAPAAPSGAHPDAAPVPATDAPQLDAYGAHPSYMHALLPANGSCTGWPTPISQACELPVLVAGVCAM